MKRSEMLEKMVFSMELHAGNDPAWLDQMPGMKARALDYADKILRYLEEAGMMPPKACIERSVRVGDEERIAYHNTHEWEPENDLP